MANDIVRLGKETLVYGTSTVIARLLNFCLVPFYTYYLVTSDYGVVATLFALIALLNVIFLFGMDQSYLRFASEAQQKREVHFGSQQPVVQPTGIEVPTVGNAGQPVAQALQDAQTPSVVEAESN